MYTYMDYYEKKNDDMLFETLEERTNHKGKAFVGYLCCNC